MRSLSFVIGMGSEVVAQNSKFRKKIENFSISLAIIRNDFNPYASGWQNRARDVILARDPS